VEKTYTVEFGAPIDKLFPNAKQVDDIQFRVMVDEVDHPDVQALLHTLHQITVKFHNGEYPIPANVEFIESFIGAIEQTALLEHKLCLCWTHAMGKVDGEMLLQIRAHKYEHAAPIGYTKQ
jgi:hypothetical protein